MIYRRDKEVRVLDSQEKTLSDHIKSILDETVVKLCDVETHYENCYPVVTLLIVNESYSIAEIKKYLYSLRLPQVINYKDGIGCNEVSYDLSYSTFYDCGRRGSMTITIQELSTKRKNDE